MSRTSSFPATLFSISFYYDHHLSKEAKMLNQNILKELSPLSPYASASERSHRHWIWTEESATFFSFILYTCLIDCVAFPKKKRSYIFFIFFIYLFNRLRCISKKKKEKEEKKRRKKILLSLEQDVTREERCISNPKKRMKRENYEKKATPPFA